MLECSYELYVFGIKIIHEFVLISESIWFKMFKIEIFMVTFFTLEVSLVAHVQHAR